MTKDFHHGLLGTGSRVADQKMPEDWVNLRMEFHFDHEWIITSRVQSITVQAERSLPGPF